LELSPIQTLKELARIAAHTGVYMVSRAESLQKPRKALEEEKKQ
jgi:hypothetical protein